MSHRAFLRFLLRRLVFALVLVFLVSSGSLLLTHLAPGDATSELRRPGVSDETVALERAKLGLDRSFVVQYMEWVVGVARLDLGRSTRYGRPVAELLAERTRNTALLAAVALIAASAVGLWAGIASASRPTGFARPLISGASLVAVSVPPLLASLLLALLAARTGWFPVGGITSVGTDGLSWIARVTDVAWHLALPAFAVALPLAATIDRLQSQAMDEALGTTYVRAAVGRGIPWRRVVWGHALPVAIRPVLGVYGIILGSVFSGSFAVEIVTAWPGLGQLMYEALVSRDLYLVSGCAIAGSLFLALGNLFSDVALLVVDPRLRASS